jgi:glutamine synthetase
MIALNSVVAAQLIQFKKDVDKLIDANVKKDEAIFQVLKKYITECKPVRFDGNGYSEEWAIEAERRGLTNIKSVPLALDAYLMKGSRKIFETLGIFNEKELEGRVEVEFEKYIKKIQIESRVLGDLAINHIVPTAITYQTMLIENVKGLKLIFSDDEFTELAGARKDLIKEISSHISNIKSKTRDMIEARKAANVIEHSRERALAYEQNVKPYLEDIRYHIDKLELVVDNELWPLPKYRELLFTR